MFRGSDKADLPGESGAVYFGIPRNEKIGNEPFAFRSRVVPNPRSQETMQHIALLERGKLPRGGDR